jgi:hypothetical protein
VQGGVDGTELLDSPDAAQSVAEAVLRPAAAMRASLQIANGSRAACVYAAAHGTAVGLVISALCPAVTRVECAYRVWSVASPTAMFISSRPAAASTVSMQTAPAPTWIVATGVTICIDTEAARITTRPSSTPTAGSP